MGKDYKRIEFMPGENLEKAVKELQDYNQSGELVYGVFNGQKLYSDIDTKDTAYKKVTGKTKEEYDAYLKEESDRYKREQKEHEEKIPELTKEWIQKGNEILDAQYQSEWARIVPIRLKDLYRGMELKASLDIIGKLNSGCSLDEAKRIIEDQGHSGMSFGLVCSMIREFCKRGSEFVAYVK